MYPTSSIYPIFTNILPQLVQLPQLPHLSQLPQLQHLSQCNSLLQMYICIPMYPTFLMYPIFTDVYLYPDVPHFLNVPHFYKCIVVPQCTISTKYGTLLLMSICTAMHNNMVQNMVHFGLLQKSTRKYFYYPPSTCQMINMTLFTEFTSSPLLI